MLPWFKADPSRWVAEAEAFRAAGFPFRLDTERLREGTVVYHVDVTVDDAVHCLRVEYPAGFPNVRPTVYAPDADLSLHQHRREKHLCLVKNGPEGWNPGMVAAQLVQRGQHLFALYGQGREAVLAESVAIPEPVSEYYDFATGDVCLVPGGLSGLPLRPGEVGSFDASVVSGAFPNGEPPFIRVEIRSLPAPSRVAPTGCRQGVYVHCVSTPDPRLSGVDLWNSYATPRVVDDLRRTTAPYRTGELPSWLALLFEEEGPKPGESHVALILLRANRNVAPNAVRIARPVIVEEGALFTRNPVLSGLRDTAVSIVGLGSIGSGIAEHLVRAGVGSFVLIDPDRIEPPNLARHTTTRLDVGKYKTRAVAERLASINQVVRTAAGTGAVGAGVGKVGRDILEGTLNAFNQTNLVICCVGDVGIHALVDGLARQAGRPVVHAWVTNGAWGGEVVVTHPEAPCFRCHQAASAPQPPASDAAIVWSAGCGVPSFTGTGYDIAMVVAPATREAVRLLLGQPSPHNHLVIDTGAGSGLPNYTVLTIARDEGCPCAVAD